MSRKRAFSVLVLGLWLAALVTVGPPANAASVDSGPTGKAAAAPLDEMPALANEDGSSTEPGRDGAEEPTAAPDQPSADPMAQVAELQAAMRDLQAAGSDPAKRAEAMQRLQNASKAAMVTNRPARGSAERAAEIEARLPAEWREVRREDRSGTEAELMVQLGDIDNLGFGWPRGFDPFSGKSTPIHAFPFAPEADDPEGTDRIFVISGFRSGTEGDVDGYTRESSRPENAPRPLVLEYDASGLEVRAAVLQLFVDDFQSERMGSRYRVWINDREVPDLAATLNALEQTGPVGKLLNIRLLPEYHDAVASGRLEIRVDDPATDAGDGFAFDFVRLLVNPTAFRYSGTVRGVARDKDTGLPLSGVLVSAANVREALSDDAGRFTLTEVPAGLVVTSGSKPGYESDSRAADLEHGEVLDVSLELAPMRNDVEALAGQLRRERRADLYGIYFDTDKATLRPESEETLQQVLGVLAADPLLRLIIAGHTDSEGGDDHNRALSERRAAAVVGWLVGEGVDATRLVARGLGEAEPVADNATPAGRALNRRVELRLAE
jgi:outer membrane protein OmpA-like peptidoglycan-associated protein